MKSTSSSDLLLGDCKPNFVFEKELDNTSTVDTSYLTAILDILGRRYDT